MRTEMPSSLEIAQAATLRPIEEIAAAAGLVPEEVEPYGRTKAKIDLGVLDRLRDTADGKLICVTAITPTKAGEGKTTTSVSLTQGLGHIGRKSVLCLREASLGPVFGIKGGAAGGGYAQVVPMEDLNLHFTGDIHAIGAANNLLAAMLEAHILHGNTLGIDPLSVGWRRCVDINDRALRDIALGLGGRANGYPRQSGFDITAASEVMAIVAVARDLHDLRERLGAITVAYTFEGEPVLAEQLRAAGAMAVLLKDALKPNLVQTLEGQPALVHCGPFANIAHGNNSLVADLVALKLGDYVVTESGFGADMGMEKFLNIVCRAGGLSPSAVVLVATAKALKHHGGDPDGGLGCDRTRRREPAAPSRDRVRVRAAGGRRGQPVPGRLGRGGGPRPPARARARRARCRAERGVRARWRGRGIAGRGGRRRRRSSERVRVHVSDRRSDRGEDRGDRDACLRRRQRASSSRPRRTRSSSYAAGGLDRLPICMAKTHLSLSHDPALDERADRIRGDRARRPRLHGRRLARRALRDDADHARARVRIRRRSASTSTRTAERLASSSRASSTPG